MVGPRISGGGSAAPYLEYRPIIGPSSHVGLNVDSTSASGFAQHAGVNPGTRESVVMYSRGYTDIPIRVSGVLTATSSYATVGTQGSILTAVAIFGSDGMIADGTRTGLPTTYLGGMLPADAISILAARNNYSNSGALNTRGLRWNWTPFDLPVGPFWLVTMHNLFYTPADTVGDGTPFTNGSIPFPTTEVTGNNTPRNLLWDALLTSSITSYASWSAAGVENPATTSVVSANSAAATHTISTKSVTGISQHEAAYRLICQRI
jgi:hypothetical protein